MARIPDSFIDDVLARTDIVELIGARVQLKKAGREYHANCPFHDERTPSFTVSPNKQFYHCFGCGAHGTAIAFLMNYDRLEFLDAVEELAKRVGMEVPKDTRVRNEDSGSKELYSALDAAAHYFQKQLPQHPAAVTYLQQRGISTEIIEQFGIGYAPNQWDGLKNALATDERRTDLLERVGMMSKSDNGRVYDKFRHRVMFPIHDKRGRVIAFGGRVIDNDDSPKYLNSPETQLFHKGRELYGLWQVKLAHNKIPRLVVVEGYIDVVALFQFGVNTAVATLGTATTPEHAEILFRHAEDVYFCFDGDNAGRKAAWRALESVIPRLRDGRQAHFLFLPDGEDPDSIVRKEGSAGFDTRLHAATPLSEFLFDSLGKDISLSSIDGKARLAERAKPLLEKLPDGAFRDLMFQQLQSRTGVQTSAMTAPEPSAPSVSPPSRNRGSAPRRSLVRTAIAMLLQRPALVQHIQPPFLFVELKQPGIDILVGLIASIRERPQISTGMLLEHFADRQESAALAKLATMDMLTKPEQWDSEFVGSMARLNLDALRQKRDALMAKQRLSGLSSFSEEERAALRDIEPSIRQFEAQIRKTDGESLDKNSR